MKGKHDLPEDSIAMRGITQKQITDDLLAKERSDRASTYRPKGETPEERVERKKAIKEERRVRWLKKYRLVSEISRHIDLLDETNPHATFFLPEYVGRWGVGRGEWGRGLPSR